MTSKPASEKRKKKKPTKIELKIKAVEAIPVKDRWWSVWACEPSHTVASIVSEPPSQGNTTEEIWDMRRFEYNVREWMKANRDAKFLNSGIFTR